MLNARRHLVNFRVTEDEFERLKLAATLQGCRCLSEFARMVMLGTPNGQVSASSEFVEKQMMLFDRRLAELESNVTRLVDKLAGVEVAVSAH